MSVIGPFLADGKNNDASIARNIFINNEEDILNWLNDDEVIVVDRGFRDAVPTLNRFGYNVEMPAFLNGRKQLSCEESNNSRCVTKVRWVIESGMSMIKLVMKLLSYLFSQANGRIKQWKYFSQVIPNSSIPYVGGYLKIICALINKYQTPSIIDRTDGDIWATEMSELRDRCNDLQVRLERMSAAARKPQWKKYDAKMVIFPDLTEEDVRNICFGNAEPLSTQNYSNSSFRKLPNQSSERIYFRAFQNFNP